MTRAEMIARFPTAELRAKASKYTDLELESLIDAIDAEMGTIRQLTRAASVDRTQSALGFDSTDVERDSSGVPVAFRIWRAGANPTDSGDHVLTPRSVVTLLTLQKQRGNLFSIDVDHMSLNSQAPPENHKAVGWFTIEARHGDLWAVNVEWTDDVRAGLAKDPPEWRYFSPAYDTKRDSGEIVRLLNIAVTNNPATWNVTALAGATGEEHRVAAAAAAHSFDFAEDEERHYAIMYWAPRDGAIGH